MPFQNVGPVQPPRSTFDLSHDVKLTLDMGELVPILALECVPGDVINLRNEIVIRMQPMIAPILHEINVYTHSFFVPCRLLMSDDQDVNRQVEWETFITGGINGDGKMPGAANAVTLPRWIPGNNLKGSLWDYLGFPPGVNPVGAYPLSFTKRAYNLIYNEYYRDQDIIKNKVNLDSEQLQVRAWAKDYFTIARPDVVRGTPPAFPITGLGSVNFLGTVYDSGLMASGNAHLIMGPNGPRDTISSDPAGYGTPFKEWLNNNEFDLSNAVSFDVSDLRHIVQLQKWMERNMRAGVRYKEFLEAHFGVSPSDERLQRPEYIGGTKAPVIISEVLQTSQSTVTGDASAQGSMTGHGISANVTEIGTYRVKEFGYIMTIMSIMPKAAYQQGIHRSFLREIKEDFYFPEFAHLSERAILGAEIYADGDAQGNNQVFGFQGMYDELRYLPSRVCGDFRDTLNYWHLGRIFSNRPQLTAGFIQCMGNGASLKRIFAVRNAPDGSSVDGFMANVGFNIIAHRPLPAIAEPGLTDHF